MKSRIEFIIRDNNLTSAKFAEKLGIQKANISHVLTGRNKPSLELFIRILEKFPNLNSDWLAFGKGNMYKSNSEEIKETTDFGSFGTLFNDTNKKIEQKLQVNEEEIPIYSTNNSKTIKKIIVYYSDGTFQEFNS